MTEPDPRADPVERFAAHALLAVGGLIFGLAGLCTLAFGVTTVMSAFQNGAGGSPMGEILVFVFTLAIFGGVPMLIGGLIFRWGRSPLAPWTRAMGDDPAARIVGWVFILLGGAASVGVLGAAVAAVAWTLPSILRRERDSGYALMLLPVAGLILSILAPVGLWLLVQGYRQSRPPRPPPASPPPQ